jgi:hypothetical protein
MILLLLAAIAQPEAQTPREFVERLYAAYSDPDYSPFKEPDQVFSSRLAAAIDEDSKLADGKSAISTATRSASARTPKA